METVRMPAPEKEVLASLRMDALLKMIKAGTVEWNGWDCVQYLLNDDLQIINKTK